MKNKSIYYLICWAILVAIFNTIVFVSTTATTELAKLSVTFWIGYAFIMLSFVGQLCCALYTFNAKSVKNMFFSLSLVTISYSALIVSIITGTACMTIPFLPYWVGIIICTVILGFSAISLVKAKTAADISQSVEVNIACKTVFIKKLTVSAQALLPKAKTSEIKALVEKVCQAFRYSDPISNEALSDIETRINEEFSVFTDAVLEDNMQKVTSSCGELQALIKERNASCRLYK